MSVTPSSSSPSSSINLYHLFDCNEYYIRTLLATESQLLDTIKDDQYRDTRQAFIAITNNTVLIIIDSDVRKISTTDFYHELFSKQIKRVKEVRQELQMKCSIEQWKWRMAIKEIM